VASALTFVFFNFLFWIIINCQCRVYFTLATIAAFIFVSRTWVNQIWPEIRVPIPDGEDTEEWTPVNPQVLSVPEISLYLDEMWDALKDWGLWLIELRQSQPGKFCILMTCLLVTSAFIGHYLSGVLISYILMMVIMLAPGFFFHIYPHISNLFTTDLFSIVQQNQACRATLNESDDLDEYLPEPNRETMAVLACALNSLETDNEESLFIASKDLGLEDFTSNEGEDFSLQTGLGDLPSFTRDSDDDDGDELAGPFRTAPESVSSRKPSRVEPAMKFVSCHYNEDSDESEEERLAMGLNFMHSNENSNDSQNNYNDIPNLAISMPSQLYPTLSSEFHEGMAKSVGSPDQLLASQKCSENVPESMDDTSTFRPGVSETTVRSLTRQKSNQSDADLSDYEIVSESEFS